MKDSSQQSPEESFTQFRQSVKTLSLSTLTEEAHPNISYAPFVECEDGCFYLYLSQLASHTQDLLSHPMASVLLIEDEQGSRQLFARQRISYHCQVEVILSGHHIYDSTLDLFEERFGSIIALLHDLPDFILFKLKPYQGQYVMGFGKAYRLIGHNFTELEHIQL